jgi:ribosome-binding factor A
MRHGHKGVRGGEAGPSQRQLRAGELIRHALVEILREGDLHDGALENASITVSEVRMSPDLKHATCFVEPLGAGLGSTDPGKGPAAVVDALNRHARFLRGKLGRRIDMRFTPDLRFLHDESFDEAQRMSALFNRPDVRRDIDAHSDGADEDQDR